MNKVWLITGSARGIGAHIARAALREGHRVVVTGRDAEHLRAVYMDVPASQIAFAALDVTNEEQLAAAVQTAVERFGRIDVLVNNAGYGLLGNFEEIGNEDIRHQFDTNVFGLMNVMRAVLPQMRKQRGGHILNLSSVGGVLGFKGASVYCASKFAVEGLSASIAPEVEQFGIKVIAVEPGFFRTDFLDAKSVRYAAAQIEDYLSEGTVKDGYEAYNHQQPGDPARLGTALVKLVTEANPPKQFLAGSDALTMATAALQGRLDEIRAFSSLSRSTDGQFVQ